MSKEHEPTSNETAGRILDTAEEVFADHGFAGARVNAIATAAGVNKAMLYYYFDSKEGLYAAVLERAFEQLWANFEAHIGTQEEPDFASFLSGYRSVLRSHPHLARLVARDIVDGAPHVRKILGPRMPTLLGGMGAALTRGQQAGSINPDIDPMFATGVMVAPFVLFAIGSPILYDAAGIPPGMLEPPFDKTAEAILMRGLLARPSDDSGRDPAGGDS